MLLRSLWAALPLQSPPLALIMLSLPAMALTFAMTLASFPNFSSLHAQILIGDVLSRAGESLAFRGHAPPLDPESVRRVP